ncbi:MAG: sialidase family protein [Vicinamibacterales bacterium]
MSSSPRFLKGCAHDPECRVKVPGISVAIDGDGQAYAAYTEGSGPGQPYALLLKSSSDSGRTWSTGHPVSAAPRPQSNDRADHDDSLVAAQGNGRVCVVWVDDRRGALDTLARCSTDGGRTWGDDVWLSNRSDGAPYKSAEGFPAIYGHYGGAAISSSGRLFAVWAAGEREYRTGSVWFNSLPLTPSY